MTAHFDAEYFTRVLYELKKSVNTQRQIRVQISNVILRTYEGAKGDKMVSANSVYLGITKIYHFPVN